MKAPNPDIISAKLAAISERLARLHKYQKITATEYSQNLDYRDIVERNLEILIQAAVDLNRHLLANVLEADTDGQSAISNADSFLQLGKVGILPTELAIELAESGRFRNVLAHLYDEIDPNKVIAAIQNTLIHYPDYLSAIQQYFDETEEE